MTVDELAALGQFPHSKITYASYAALKLIAMVQGYKLDIHFTPRGRPGLHHDIEVLTLSGTIMSNLPPTLSLAMSAVFASNIKEN
ncbi:MAG: hypothetical protein OEY93_07345, partial [Anaerolineae bacterium]|nr:hypothetical protein [Anaerolineae bacterium]